MVGVRGKKRSLLTGGEAEGGSYVLERGIRTQVMRASYVGG